MAAGDINRMPLKMLQSRREHFMNEVNAALGALCQRPRPRPQRGAAQPIKKSPQKKGPH